jgi:methyl-accepting chemotaxis protein
MNKSKKLLNPPTIESKLSKGEFPATRSFTDDFQVSAKKMHEQRRKARAMAKQQHLSERLASATLELSAGVEEAQTAMIELSHALEQMAAGAEQASAACEESTLAISSVTDNMQAIATTATDSMRRGTNIQHMILNSSNEINRLIDGVAAYAKKSADSAKSIAELENQAKQIGNIIVTVVNIADQTNLLALNAAIEAARAGEHGSGFAVVAEEVRNLAEISERSAKGIREVVESIQSEVHVIAQAIKGAEESSLQEMTNGQKINESLHSINRNMRQFTDETRDIDNLLKALHNTLAEFDGGARMIAQSAETQATGSNQALRAIQEQNKVLHLISQSANDLSDMADDMKLDREVHRSQELLMIAADQLSDSIGEASQAADQIVQAIQSISQSAELQSSATEQSSVAIGQLDKSIRGVSGQANTMEGKLKEMVELHEDSKRQTKQLIENVMQNLQVLSSNIQMLLLLESRIRKVDKIVNTIDKVSIQTNMLAVNGAIEAAGAGKYGRGFVVVAADIRNLAQESSVNADTIKDLVRDIQDQVSLVIRDLLFTADTTRLEIDKARKVIDELDRIDKELDTLLLGIVNNNQSLSEVENAIADTRNAVDQITSVAAEAAAATSQAAHAGKEQSMGLNELSRAIEEIADMADEIQM